MKPIRWGVLSTANIARLVIQANRGSEVTRFVAVASRDAARAQRFAAELDLEASFGSYEALLASDLVDAVYVALPVSMHTQWTLQALEAGKHVLCEKPFATGPTDAARCVDAAERPGGSWRRGSCGATTPRPPWPAGWRPRGRSAGWRASGRR
jgi:xylose dehydrogenase (NAD/NADP)